MPTLNRREKNSFFRSVQKALNGLDPIMRFSEEYDDFPIDSNEYNILLKAEEVLLRVGHALKGNI